MLLQVMAVRSVFAPIYQCPLCLLSEIFPVTLKQNRAAKLFGLTGVYNLEVARSFIRLIDQTSLVPVMAWTLAELQSYNLGKESIEVTIGQASGVSAGTYEFKTKSYKEVFRAIEQSIHRLLYEMKTNPSPPPLPPFRPKEKQPIQQMVSPSMKEGSSGKPTSSGPEAGHKATVVENLYEGSPLQQQSGSVSNEGDYNIYVHKRFYLQFVKLAGYKIPIQKQLVSLNCVVGIYWKSCRNL